MSKYTPLELHLKNRRISRIPMTFGEIESIISNNLPPSARKHRAWWSNNPTNSVITHSWLAAGYRTSEVNLEGEHVVFVRSNDDTHHKEPAPHVAEGRDPATHPAFGCMKDTVTIPEGIDLTEPATPEWGDAAREPALYHE